MKTWTSAALVLLLPTMAAQAQEFRQLKGPEITSLLGGAEFTDESDWSFVFERGGRFKSVRLGKAGTGTWKVENDELCTTNGPGMIPCHQVWVAGPRVQLRRADDVGYPEEGLLKRASGPAAAPAPGARPTGSAPAPGAKPPQRPPAEGSPSPRPARPPQ